uniref:ATP synthase F0 subunit 8 n=1 Tax=Brachycentrus maculatus TaxID=1875239 RepID=A0A7D6W5E7_9NEOP|nr:ATP synthase F0 subunit 8 [Brachycentrus maculatus]
MPQMMPLNWNMFFLFFNFLYLLFSVMMFFNFNPKITNKNNSLK